MTIRAKFKVDSKTDNGSTTPSDLGYNICLSPVTSGSEENKEFYKWTPGGNIIISTINPTAAEQFEVGKEYYVDFSVAE